ncbi:uncharacterized protein LOC112342091 [Selaginella moellendorffii]|uniref:uncharacterized protein LOC112342091 n=1 Tax=Selaginella moellendorffii TaxID=88036 RepID=UPI000D1C4377|nr:uncharacterized protein LOC112342091 [Selaginella moellendorffii]|eukprot:XP_024519125.1 uncharacterized protein LOC112342091 [Selaginella moellendorffii]
MDRETAKSEESRDSVPAFRERFWDQLKLWRSNPSWVDEPPITAVTVPKGTLCHLKSTFKVGLPPEAVFGIITDPGNKRVFKNIKEVKYRKVIKAENNRQLVEVEQAAIWKFLWFSGTIDVRVLVDEDQSSHTVSYKLAKEGFMKRFEGTWEIKPFYVDGEPGEAGRVASLVNLHQEVQPVLIPPPPVSWYVRGITTKTTEMMIGDLQAEGKRIREGNEDDDEANLQVKNEDEGGASKKEWKAKMKSSEKWKTSGENSRWRIPK